MISPGGGGGGGTQVYVVVQNFPWFKFFQTSLIFISLCLVFIIII